MIVEQVTELGKQGLKLVCEGGGSAEIDFRERMLEHNDIQGILKFEAILEGADKVYEYRTEQMESVQTICGRHKMNREETLGILKGILAAIYRGHEFMLSENDYVVRPDTVYISETDRMVNVVYCPGYKQELRGQLCSFTEFLMDNIVYSDEAVVYAVYSFYMKLRDTSCSLESLMSVLSEANKEKIGSVKADKSETAYCTKPEAVYISEYESDRVDNAAFREIKPDPVNCKVSPAEVFRESPARLKVLTVAVPLAIIFAMTVILKSGIIINPDTGQNDVIKAFLTVLTGLTLFSGIERMMWKSFSVRLKNSMESAMKKSDEATVMLYENGTAAYPCSLVSDVFPPINVSRFPFFIGSDSNIADYTIGRIGISRNHLRIDKTGSIITVSDLCSTNGTFLNGERLRPNVPAEIRRGDELKIGNCIYYCN